MISVIINLYLVNLAFRLEMARKPSMKSLILVHVTGYIAKIYSSIVGRLIDET
jgi:hypothetical protein